MSDVKPGGPPLALSVSGLTYAFKDELPLFAGLDFDIQAGQFVSFLAPSGMGKTTLFRLLAGLLSPQAGTIKFGSGGEAHSWRAEYTSGAHRLYAAARQSYAVAECA